MVKKRLLQIYFPLLMTLAGTPVIVELLLLIITVIEKDTFKEISCMGPNRHEVNYVNYHSCVPVYASGKS